MPPKKGHRTSMPTRANNDSSHMMPARRSPRTSAPEKEINTPAPSSRTLPLSLPSTTSNSSFNIRFYTPKSPSTTSHSRNSSHDMSLNRRNTFQARPSRLSSVFTPAEETPFSPALSGRRTRRTTALQSPLQTPQTSLSDHDMSDSLGSTGWTYGQYTGGFGLDGTADPRPSPSVSSMGTRASSRIRKPTAKALEAMQAQQKPKPRRHQEDAARAPGNVADASATSSSGADPTAAMSPAVPAPAPVSTRFPRITFKNVFKPGPTSASAANTLSGPSKAGPKSTTEPASKSDEKSGPRTNARKSKKGKNVSKFTLQRIQITVGRAGQKLFDLATLALSSDFVAPADPDKLIQDARAAQQARAVEEDDLCSDTHPSDADVTAPENTPDKPELKIMLTFKSAAKPHVDQENWVHTGRINDHGEEVILTPSGYSLDRAPHTYGDEALPYPPVRTRPDVQAMNIDAFGFPPLLGDRNVPFGVQSPIQTEDGTEEMAQVQARSTASAPAENAEKAGNKRSRPEVDIAKNPATSSASAAPEEGEPSRKRRRGETVVSRPVSSEKAPRMTSASRSTKAKPKTKAPSPSPLEEEAPSQKVQRLRITVKPQAATEKQGKDSVSRENTSVRPAASQSRQRAADLASEVESTQKPAISKGRKRAAALISNDEVTEGSSSPAKRGRVAGSQVGTAAAAAPDRGPAENASSGLRGRGKGRGGGRARGASRSRGGKRGRGS